MTTVAPAQGDREIMETTIAPRTFAEAEARLALTLPGYEPRVQQQTLAQAVEQTLANGSTHLLAEAGCGVGKSLGASIPAILSGRKVVYSTATRALQGQIAEKDMPFLQEHLGVPFTFAVLKGRSNYLCPAKAQIANSGDVPNLGRILKYAEDAGPEFSGEREAFPFEIDSREWAKVCADTEDCSSLQCRKRRNPDGSHSCYAVRARIRAEASQVVIVNHALLMTDLVINVATDGNASLLGPYEAVIIDEAHELNEYAVSALGGQITERGIHALMSEVRNFGRMIPEMTERIDDLVMEVTGAVAALWGTLEKGRIRANTLKEHADEWANLANAVADLRELLDRGEALEYAMDTDMVSKRLKRLQGRVASLYDRLVYVITARFDEAVRYVEEEKDHLVVKVSPIEVSGWLRENLFGDGNAVTAVLVSATLSVGGKFDYIAKQLGIDNYKGIDVGTPFDYKRQAALYVPTHLPEPSGATRAAWSSVMVSEALELIRASQGRALFLFTSIREMQEAYKVISKRVPYRCMIQGEAPNRILAQNFKGDVHSVLFATKSFMTGFDAQGSTLSLVIIDKMPFPVPTEPVFEARAEAIVRNGGNDFRDLTIPVMTLILKQAFGRLIRHRNDMGVVAILDPRLQSKGYGKGIMHSLPPATLVTDRDMLGSFFAEVG